ncbi:MAG: hypothetical protein RIE53_07130 [Rhodothermales bacterium]
MDEPKTLYPSPRPATILRGIRTLAVALMTLGVLLVVSYSISPLRLAWLWFRQLPVPLQIGLGTAGLGLTILTVSLLMERRADRSTESNFNDP